MGSGFMVDGGFRVEDLGWRLWGAGFRIQDSGWRVHGVGRRVEGGGEGGRMEDGRFWMNGL